MTTDTLKNALKARPFRPFAIYLADGRSVRVEHPEFAAYAGGRILVVLNPEDSPHYIDLLLVTELQVDPPTTAPAGRDVTATN